MSIKQTAFIQPSPSFRGAFEVVVDTVTVTGQVKTGITATSDREVIPCANLATARTLRSRILNPVEVPVTAVEPEPNLELACGCLTGGLGYTPAVTWALTGRVERVHNWATARTLADRHPACQALTPDPFEA